MLKPSGKNGEGLWNEGEVSGYEQGMQKKKTATLKSDGLLFTTTVRLMRGCQSLERLHPGFLNDCFQPCECHKTNVSKPLR